MDTRLSALGLDEKEQRFYLAALQLGSAPVAAVAGRAGITRTSGYDILERLQRRGLLTQIQGDGALLVVAEDPVVLFSQWERTRDLIENLVPELRSLFNATRLKPRIRFYEGIEGISRVLWDTLECRSGTLYGILSMNELLETPGREEMNRFIAERVRRAITLKVLRSRSREADTLWPSSRDELRELRYAPPDIDLGMTMFIHDDTVSYLSSKQENYGLVIESREFSSLNRALFDGLWTVSGAMAPVNGAEHD